LLFSEIEGKGMNVDAAGNKQKIQPDQLITNIEDASRTETWFVLESCKFNIQGVDDIGYF